jgi:hypothetical protein
MAPAPLTEKQTQVYNLLKDDKDPKEIAEALGVSKAAIYSHIRAIKDAGHTVPAKYANVGTGGGRGSRSRGKSGAKASGRGRRSTGKAPTAVVPPAPSTPITATAPGLIAERPDADALRQAEAEALKTKRTAIAGRREEIAAEITDLESQIEALRGEDAALAGADATFEAMEATLASGPPESASTASNGKGTTEAVSLSGASK